ncbi:MAG TPA: PQQ-dependent sugar dehydrogenase, partial [Actinomycetota bacterium]|nr:PQQ-dependent sugar dehydrogenase [Actinomycetota bacterium]
RFYVNYTDDSGGDTVIAEYKRSRRDPMRALSRSHRTVLTFDQPFANHNGGHLAFGPDGYLYIASGDGGSGGDPQGNGQRRDTLLGKILRIDIDARSDGREYGIPEDNPFRDVAGAREEIWSYGLRNPWRFSFDRRTDAMWIGDVGQSEWEEIDYEAPSSEGGVNWGWNIKEGTRCFLTQSECAAAELNEDLADPIAEYPHDFGCSVTGGFVYRGQRFPDLQGFYFFADFCSGNIWTLDASNPTAQEEVLRLESGRSIASFGESRSGELFVVDRAGEVLRLVATD